MTHKEFEDFDSMVLSHEQKLLLRNDYIAYLEYKIKKLEGRERILLELAGSKQNVTN